MKIYYIMLIACLQVTNLFSQENETMSIKTYGLCGMCQDRIVEAAISVDGVSEAEWDMDTGILHLTKKPNTDTMAIHKALVDVGHDTDVLQANDEIYNELPGCCQYRSEVELEVHGQIPAPTNSSNLEEAMSMKAYGICDMCQDRIEKAANSVEGVTQADWDMDHNILHLTKKSDTDTMSIHQALIAVGHDTDVLTATDEVYAQLHSCCKYRPEPGSEFPVHHPQNPESGGLGQMDGNSAPISIGEKNIEGMVYSEDEEGKREALIGVHVYWAGQPFGALTDEEGHFNLPKGEADNLVFSYVGFASDTIDMTGESMVAVVMQDAYTLDAVEVRHRQKSTRVSFLNPIKSHKIGERELLKAACCNLSESFETTPSIDVSSTDAITGTRKIEMLGLNGANIQIARENIPYIRGLSSTYGLEYVPGPWIQGIQLNMGAGSVANGFESITGQINIELKKPTSGDRFYLNLYGSEGGRYEANINARTQINEKWSTALLFHQRYQDTKTDKNVDGFRDDPNSTQTFVVNRWKYEGDKGWMSQFGLVGLHIDKKAGQIGYDSEQPNVGLWGSEIKTKRYEGWAKVGRVFPNKPYASFGFQLAGSYHDQEAFFGGRDYNSDQNSLYANFIYQSIFNNTLHTFRTGLSFQYDDIDEKVLSTNFSRSEKVPGAFFEYNYLPTENFSLVAGIRGDVHNNYGLFFTPRLHIRYAPIETSVIRLSIGRGQRTPSIFSENIGLFASSREINVQSTDATKPYGLDPNVAWSFGFNYTQEWTLQSRSLIFEIDLHRTQFSDQVVADYDASPQAISFYNLEGSSYSNSFQATVNYELFPRFDVRLAYRYNDVQVDYNQGRLQKPLTASQRGFINLAYQTSNDWSFDFTLNKVGSKRIPETNSNPEVFRMISQSPAYFLSNAQISKSWAKKFDVYMGAENLFDYRQEEAILSAQDPFGPFFDASLIWGPVFGRKVYAGIRYRI